MTDKILQTSAENVVQPLISVVLPVYNGEKYLAEAIDSILAQTFTNFELIMIDDGSSDHSLQILRQYELRSPRIRVVTRENHGLAATLNELINMARGDLIARMDQDDICRPNRLSNQYEFMQQHPEVVALGCSANFMDAEGNLICTYLPPTDDASLRKIFPDSPFVHPSVMMRKDVLIKSGKYPEKMKWGGEDVILFGRMAKIGILHNLSETLIDYRLVPGSMSRKPPEFRSNLTCIIIDEIAGNLVADKHMQLLQQAAKKIDKSQADSDYHLEVAKLYIWAGSGRKASIMHLRKCYTLGASFAKVLFMCILALMPQCLIRFLYFKLKGRRFEKTAIVHSKSCAV